MTTEECAEKIAIHIHELQYPGIIHVEWNETGGKIVAYIAAMLEGYASERVEEAVKKPQALLELSNQAAVHEAAQASVEAYEECKAKIQAIEEKIPGMLDEAQSQGEQMAYQDAAKIAESEKVGTGQLSPEHPWAGINMALARTANAIRARAKALEGPNTSRSDPEVGK